MAWVIAHHHAHLCIAASCRFESREVQHVLQCHLDGSGVGANCQSSNQVTKQACGALEVGMAPQGPAACSRPGGALAVASSDASN